MSGVSVSRRMLSVHEAIDGANGAPKMTDKERRAALRGKRIVIPGAGHVEKGFIIERAVELGCNVIVVDLPDSYARELEGIELFIEVNPSINNINQLAGQLIRLMRHLGTTGRYVEPRNCGGRSRRQGQGYRPKD